MSDMDADHTDAHASGPGDASADHATGPRTTETTDPASSHEDVVELQERLEAADPSDAPDIAEALASRLARELDDGADS